MISPDSTLSELLGRLVNVFTTVKPSQDSASNTSSSPTNQDVSILDDLVTAISFCLHIFGAMLIRHFLDHSGAQSYITRTVMIAVQLAIVAVNAVPVVLQAALVLGIVYAHAPQINQLLIPAITRIRAYAHKYTPHQTEPIDVNPVPKYDQEQVDKLKITITRACEDAVREHKGLNPKYQTNRECQSGSQNESDLIKIISTSIDQTIKEFRGENPIDPHIDEKKNKLVLRILEKAMKHLNPTASHRVVDNPSTATPVTSMKFKPKAPDTSSSKNTSSISQAAPPPLARPISPDDQTDSECTTPPGSPVPAHDKNQDSANTNASSNLTS